MPHETLLIDIGNTCMKVKHLSEINSYVMDKQTLDTLSNTIVTNNIKQVMVSSVNSDVASELMNFLQKHNVSIINTADLIQQQMIIDFSNIQGIGEDRKLGLLGASMLFPLPVIVVDCGTATTVSVLGNDNICYGGTIMLGVGAHARALTHFTAALPKVKITFAQKDILLDNTEDAIRQGLISAARGGIIDSITTVFYKIPHSNEVLKDVNIIFTGGFGEGLMCLSKNGLEKNYLVRNYVKSVQFKDNLVLTGIERLQYLI